uniref:Kappa-conotoxin Mo1659 n=2 Tax=Conus monile TaxID=351660 RepID=CMO1_CONMO|nr:RecName: Full=Kappa-conotoxin Mo1659 [Conus monile]
FHGGSWYRFPWGY